MSAERLRGVVLTTLGASIGTLGTSLLYELAPSAVTFKEGVNPTLQGALVGAVLIGLLAITAALIEVEA